MAARRSEVIASASALWRERGIEGVSMQEISQGAGVVPQTVYNLIGGVDAVIFAVISELLDRLDVALAQVDDRGVERSLRCVRESANLFAIDPGLYRQLVVRIPQAIFAGANFTRDSADSQVRAVRQAQEAGDLDETVDPNALGHHIFVGYMGALYAWACGGLEETGFIVAAEIAALAPLAACATPKARPELLARLTNLLAPQSFLGQTSA